MVQKDVLWNEYLQLKNNEVSSINKDKLIQLENKLIEEYIYLVKYIASRLDVYLMPYIDIDDLISAGIFGLMDAIKKFDKTKNTSFLTYATLRIRGSMLDEIRNLDWVPRSQRSNQKKLEKVVLELETTLGRTPSDEEVAKELKMSIEEYREFEKSKKLYSIVSLEDQENLCNEILINENSLSPNEYTEKKEKEIFILNTLKKLPEKERFVIYYYYFEDLKLKDISKKLNMCESRASQLHKKGLKTLNTLLKESQYSSLLDI